jgi:hypothetical protein
MDIHASLDAPCSADALFAFVDDLVQYQRWSTLVHRAEPVSAVAGAWQVELRARVGPLARSKRLRMQRTERDPVAHVAVFERSEVDGKRHAPWVLRVEVSEVDGVSTLRMHLHYGGGLWTGGVLERVLADQITSGRDRLLELVSTTH